jgi:hypothetical protein
VSRNAIQNQRLQVIEPQNGVTIELLAFRAEPKSQSQKLLPLASGLPLDTFAVPSLLIMLVREIIKIFKHDTIPSGPGAGWPLAAALLIDQ